MKLIIMIGTIIMLASPMALFAQFNKQDSQKVNHPEASKQPPKVQKSEEEWKKTLTPEQYQILREKGTERPYTGKFNDHKEEGVYTCAACNHELFTSKEKFDSHCGWPSFYDAVADDKIVVKTDFTHGMKRTEIMCANCGGHLGHVFDDGPKPTGLRYCVNSVSLNFKAVKVKPTAAK